MLTPYLLCWLVFISGEVKSVKEILAIEDILEAVLKQEEARTSKGENDSEDIAKTEQLQEGKGWLYREHWNELINWPLPAIQVLKELSTTFNAA